MRVLLDNGRQHHLRVVARDGGVRPPDYRLGATGGGLTTRADYEARRGRRYGAKALALAEEILAKAETLKAQGWAGKNCFGGFLNCTIASPARSDARLPRRPGHERGSWPRTKRRIPTAPFGRF